MHGLTAASSWDKHLKGSCDSLKQSLENTGSDGEQAFRRQRPCSRPQPKAVMLGPVIPPEPRGHLMLLAGGGRPHLLQARVHLLQPRERAPFRNPAPHIVDGASQTRRQ